MRGSKAKKLKKMADLLYEQRPNGLHPVDGRANEGRPSIVLRHDPMSPRAMYKSLKRRLRNGGQ